MNYEELGQEDFDAVVTGELTHYALCLEDELNDIITRYFCRTTEIQKDFRRLILFRDGLTSQDKIEIVRGMIPLFNLKDEQVAEPKAILKRIEDFKSWRNAMAHGVDVTGDKFEGVLKVEVVNRAGKERVIEITPQSHREKMEEAEGILKDIKKAKENILGVVNVT
jgi:hypothetical protein